MGKPQFDEERRKESRRIELQQVELWEKKFIESSEMNDDEKLEQLRLGLRNMGIKYGYDNPSSEVRNIYRKIQSTLLSIPGHAQYFADEVERSRKSVEGVPRGRQGDYDWIRSLYLWDTLPHLPSPETVRVLGHYLDDMQDEAPPGFQLGENAYLALSALSRIGLRDSSVQPIRSYKKITNNGVDIRQEPLARMRAWYAKVKSGELTFSFIGQPVEYRFNPDGTWETIPLEQSAIPPDEEAVWQALLAHRPSLQPASRFPAAIHSLWPWLAACGLLLIFGFAWWLKRRRTPSAPSPMKSGM